MLQVGVPERSSPGKELWKQQQISPPLLPVSQKKRLPEVLIVEKCLGLTEMQSNYWFVPFLIAMGWSLAKLQLRLRSLKEECVCVSVWVYEMNL